MIFYYRKLSVVIVAGLMVWGLTVFDAAVVRVEHVELRVHARRVRPASSSPSASRSTPTWCSSNDIRTRCAHGRSLATPRPRSFKATWRTIVVGRRRRACSAAVVLFWLSVGSVKGFALYLGLTTVCDLLVCYFFTRPAVFLLAQTRWLSAEATKRRVDADRSDVMTRHDAHRHEPRPRRRRGQSWHPSSARDVGPPRRVADGDRLRRRAAGRVHRSPAMLILLTVVSLCTQGLNLGIDFEGGSSWDVPAANVHDRRRRARCSSDNGLSAEGARIQERSSDSRRPSSRSRSPISRPRSASRCVRRSPRPPGSTPTTISVNLVSSTWGSEITEKAIRALVIFLLVVARVHLDPVRVADGARADHRHDPRRRDQRRDLLDVPVRGHARRR